MTKEHGYEFDEEHWVELMWEVRILHRPKPFVEILDWDFIDHYKEAIKNEETLDPFLEERWRGEEGSPEHKEWCEKMRKIVEEYPPVHRRLEGKLTEGEIAEIILVLDRVYYAQLADIAAEDETGK